MSRPVLRSPLGCAAAPMNLPSSDSLPTSGVTFREEPTRTTSPLPPRFGEPLCLAMLCAYVYV